MQSCRLSKLSARPGSDVKTNAISNKSSATCTNSMAPSSSRRASPSDPTAEKAIITSSTSSSSETTPLIGIQNDDTTTDVECGKLPAPRPHSISEDVLDTLKLGVPIFVAMLSWVGMKSTDTALLGHVGSDALSAAALSDLWTS